MTLTSLSLQFNNITKCEYISDEIKVLSYYITNTKNNQKISIKDVYITENNIYKEFDEVRLILNITYLKKIKPIKYSCNKIIGKYMYFNKQNIMINLDEYNITFLQLQSKKNLGIQNVVEYVFEISPKYSNIIKKSKNTNIEIVNSSSKSKIPLQNILKSYTLYYSSLFINQYPKLKELFNDLE